MIESILQIVGAALSIWESKEKTKYSDRMIDLKKRYYEELNKDPSIRDGAVLVDILDQLRILCDSISSAIIQKNP